MCFIAEKYVVLAAVHAAYACEKVLNNAHSVWRDERVHQIRQISLPRPDGNTVQQSGRTRSSGGGDFNDDAFSVALRSPAKQRAQPGGSGGRTQQERALCRIQTLR